MWNAGLSKEFSFAVRSLGNNAEKLLGREIIIAGHSRYHDGGIPGCDQGGSK